MIQYILEIIAFQLLFLVVYDLFLKRETFFQWNRFYLMGTFLVAIVLPWIKIEAFKTTVSQEFVGYPMLFWQLDGIAVTPAEEETSWLASLPTEYIVFGIGALLSALWFGYKLFQIYRLKENGTIRYYKDFTKVVVKKSELAFSFFKNIFLGEQIKKENEANIVAHELVHIKQWHSLDLLFFEIMRIAFWFNPLVYVYQNRVSELHEFIADSIVAKTNKKEQYQLLLAEAFQTQNISFVNQFFKRSLIKKRIIMLSKTKSKKVYQFKYLLLVPLVLGMLLYTSCEEELPLDNREVLIASSNDDAGLIASIEDELEGKSIEEIIRSAYILGNEGEIKDKLLSKEDFFRRMISLRLAINKVYEKSKMERKVDIPYPSTEKYNSYVNREIAFKQLDKNLKVSINPNDFSVRLVQKDDKNLGPGEFMKVGSVKDLTGQEIRKINRTLESIKGSKSFLFLSDDNSSFLIASVKNANKVISSEEQTISQTTYSESIPFEAVDEVPIFPGCENATDKKECFQEKMVEHIKKHFNYPKEAQDMGVQGRVSLVFIISTDGSIKNIRKRGPHELLENEAVRIIERLPPIQPGKQDGQAVEVPFSIPITFKLN
ncbi:TonB family protein [Croceitalea marina]|uniref:TonB family protein n=1 Tax=Croceitalea marina TaxID=1775166 RepID=A0ABW5MYX1_9FLAO